MYIKCIWYYDTHISVHTGGSLESYIFYFLRKIDIRYHHTKEIYWSEAAFALARKWIIFLQAKEGIYIQQKMAIFGKAILKKDLIDVMKTLND